MNNYGSNVRRDVPCAKLKLFWRPGQRLMISLVTMYAGLALQRLGARRLPLASRRQLTEALLSLHEDRGLAVGRLVAANDNVDVQWIDLDAAAKAAGSLRGDAMTSAATWMGALPSSRSPRGLERRSPGLCHRLLKIVCEDARLL